MRVCVRVCVCDCMWAEIVCLLVCAVLFHFNLLFSKYHFHFLKISSIEKQLYNLIKAHILKIYCIFKASCSGCIENRKQLLVSACNFTTTA